MKLEQTEQVLDEDGITQLSDEGGMSRRDFLAAIGVVGVALIVAGRSRNGHNHPSSPSTTSTTSPEIPPSTSTTSTTEAVTTTTASTAPPETVPAIPEAERRPVGDAQFLGTITFNRASGAAADDASVTHRLNTGIWATNPANNTDFVDTNPMLNHGPVYDQISGGGERGKSFNILGVPGYTAVIASHDVTRPPDAEQMLTTENGVSIAQPRMMESVYNQNQLNLPIGRRNFLPNANPGDQYVIKLNNTDDTITVLTYQVETVNQVIPNSPEFLALYNKPADESSLLKVYWCWPPTSEQYRQVAHCRLITQGFEFGQIPTPADNQPIAGTIAN